MPWLWNQGVNFWVGLALGCMLTAALYIATAAILARFGVIL
jgi:hypothetical protein